MIFWRSGTVAALFNGGFPFRAASRRRERRHGIRINNLHIVHARAAGLDIHRTQITETGVSGSLPDGLAELVRWPGDFGVTAAVDASAGLVRIVGRGGRTASAESGCIPFRLKGGTLAQLPAFDPQLRLARLDPP